MPGKHLHTAPAGSRLAIVLTTVIVTTAVIAGGVAVATVGINSVGSPQIKNGSVQSADIATGAVKSVDIANGQVRSVDIANDTIRSADINDDTVRGADIRDDTITGIDIANNTVAGVDLAASAQPAGLNFADGDQILALTSTDQTVRSVVLDAPAPGQVMVTASGFMEFGTPELDQGQCSITDGAIALDSSHQMVFSDFEVETSQQAITMSGTRSFGVPAGPTTFRLVCRETSGSVTFVDSQVTALYVPQLYAP